MLASSSLILTPRLLQIDDNWWGSEHHNLQTSPTIIWNDFNSYFVNICWIQPISKHLIKSSLPSARINKLKTKSMQKWENKFYFKNISPFPSLHDICCVYSLPLFFDEESNAPIRELIGARRCSNGLFEMGAISEFVKFVLVQKLDVYSGKLNVAVSLADGTRLMWEFPRDFKIFHPFI